MAEWILEPYAATMIWRLPQPGAWGERVGEYLVTLAERCMRSGPCVIGHLKALALFDDGGYLQVSVVGAGLPITIQGQAPSAAGTLTMTLNALVYGLPHARLAQLAADSATVLANRWKGECAIETGDGQEYPAPGHPAHDHPADSRDDARESGPGMTGGRDGSDIGSEAIRPGRGRGPGDRAA